MTSSASDAGIEPETPIPGDRAAPSTDGAAAVSPPPGGGEGQAPAAPPPEAAPLPPEVYVKRRRSLLRRFAVLIAGSVVILGAILIGPLPGPGFMILGPIGLAILATEFEWARRVLDRLKSGASDLQVQTDRLTGMVSRIWILPVVAVYWFLVWQATRLLERPDDRVVWVVGISAFIPVSWACYRIAVLRARKQPLRKLWHRIQERRRARRSALRRAGQAR